MARFARLRVDTVEWGQVVCGTQFVGWLLSPELLCPESTPSTIGLITLGVKPTGKRSAANPHAPFEVAGDGNLAYAVAPFLDPTDAAGDGNLVYTVAPSLDPTCAGDAG